MSHEFTTGSEALTELHERDLSDLTAVIDWIDLYVFAEFTTPGTITTHGQDQEIVRTFELAGYVRGIHGDGSFDETDPVNHGTYVIGLFLSLMYCRGPVALNMAHLVKRCSRDWLCAFAPSVA